MKIVWGEQAVERINETADYIQKEFGVVRCVQFLENVQKEADSLLLQPKKGQIEPILRKSKFEFRRLIVENLNKMIYLVNEDTIEIVDFWATRMDLKKLANNILKKH